MIKFNFMRARFYLKKIIVWVIMISLLHVPAKQWMNYQIGLVNVVHKINVNTTKLTCFSITLFCLILLREGCCCCCCWLPEAPSLLSRLSVLTDGMTFAVFSMSLKLWINSLKISQLPKLRLSTDFNSWRSQYRRTRPVIAFSRRIGANFSIVLLSSFTCDNKVIKSSQLNLDNFVCVRSCDDDQSD